jgi:hypothetical protein
VIPAKFAGYLKCGHLVAVGEPIGKTARGWMCATCYLNGDRRENHQASPPRRRETEQLLADPKIKALLCKALVTDSPPEALACLTKARELHLASEKVPA